jgi:type I restriction enzyme S subunit
MDEKGALVPRLRFPEFREAGEWGVRELGDLAIKVGSGITPRGGGKCYKAVGRPFVRSQNVGWGELLLDDVAYIDEGTHKSFASTEIKDFDVLLNISGASIGRSAIADTRIASGNVNQHVCIIRVKQEDLNPILLNQFLLSKYGQSQIDSFQAGGNRQGLNFGQIRSFKLQLPPSVTEQQKIADCLSSLDALIAAQTDKIDALKTHKKGLMQQLFPREGETVPRLRFPEFQGGDEWKTIQLQDLSTIIRGASPRPRNDPKFYGGDIPRLMGRDVSRDGKWVTPCIDFLTKEGARLSRFCEKGTLTIICSGDVGVPSFLAVDACIHDGFLALIDIDTSRIDVDYLYYCLVNLQRVFNSSATHGGVYNNLTTMILKEFSIGLPNLEEQNMIANCFSSLDSLLAEHTEKLDALKTHKKGLMQELFPRPEAVSE